MTDYKERIVGPIQDFNIDPSSPTGYSITFLVDGAVVSYVCTKDVYDSQFLPENVFPLVTEALRKPIVDQNGVCVGYEKADINNNENGSYHFGCPRTIGYVVQLEGNKLVVNGKHFNQMVSEDRIAYYGSYARSGFPLFPNEERVELPLTEDVNIYALNFKEGERKHSKKNLAYLDDVLRNKRNCFWMNMHDVYNGKGMIDHIELFLHPDKDPDACPGDLNKTQKSREERFKEATGANA